MSEMTHPLLEGDPMWKVLQIVNEVGTTWKVKRALLREQCGLQEEVIRKLVPEDSPSDY